MERGRKPEGGDNSLGKQLSISWWPQGQPQLYVRSPREAKAWGKGACEAALLENSVLPCGVLQTLSGSQRKGSPGLSPTRGCSLWHQQQLGEPWKNRRGVKIQENPSPPSIAEAQPWTPAQQRGEARFWTVVQPRTGLTLRCSPWMPQPSSPVGSAAPEVIKLHSIPSCCKGLQDDSASAISSANLLWFESGNNGGRLPRAQESSHWLLLASVCEQDAARYIGQH